MAGFSTEHVRSRWARSEAIHRLDLLAYQTCAENTVDFVL